MYFRGIRGATVADENSELAILAATGELLEKMISLNNLSKDAIASIFF